MPQPSEALCIFIARVSVRSAGTAASQWRYCFIPAPNQSAAQARLPEAVSAAGCELVETEFVCSYWDYEWSSAAEQKQYDRLAEKAYHGREPVLAPAEKAK
jgi:hypothetical protein